MAVAIPVTPVATFDPHGEPSSVYQRWEKWLRTFKTYSIATGCTQDVQKRMLLLHCAGPEVQDIFDTLTDTGTSCQEAETALDTYFKPKQNIPYNRHVFRQACQTPEETTLQFITRLRKLSLSCEFGESSNDFIRDQVIEKCQSHLMRKKLLAVADLTLDKLIQLSQAFETSEFQASQMSEGTPSVTVKDEKTNAIFHGNPKHHAGRNKRIPFKSSSSQNRVQAQPSPQSPCSKCGMRNHRTEECRCSKNVRCFKCNRVGHFASVCRSSNQNRRPSGNNRNRQQNSVNQIDSTSEPADSVSVSPDFLFALNDKLLETHTVNIANQPVEALIDSGSTCNIVSLPLIEKLDCTPQLISCDRQIKPYNSEPIAITTKVCLPVSSNVPPQESVNAEFLIVPKTEVALIGRDLATQLNLLRVGPPTSADHTNTISDTVSSVLQQYPGLGSGIGKLKDFQVKLHIDPSVQPVAHQHSRVPFHLRDKIEQEIDKLLQSDIIEPVFGPTEWVSRIVTPPKPNDPTKIRLCIDMRNANKAILRTRHPTPTIEDLIHDINGATVFSKLDLTAGYHQLELHPSCRHITTFSTHIGLFRYKRLNFGVNAAAELFQHTIQSLIADIAGARNVSDDIIIFGKTQADHDRALHAVLSRLHSRGLTVNASKVVINQPSIEFFGFQFSAKGISPSPSKVQALRDSAPPNNPSEVRSFLGMAQYSARFIKDFATTSEPLRRLTHKNAKWQFGPKEMTSFNCIRNSLTDVASNAYFDPAKDTVVLVDASPVGISAILTQNDRPVVFASRALNPVEQRYSQIEREALAVIWSCEHLNVYLQGRPFKCLTDHKPLIGIWQKTNLPLRLARWALRLQSYDITLRYRPGHDNPADYMSRHPVNRSSVRNITEEYVNFIATTSVPRALTLSEVQAATAQDATLQHVMKMQRQGRWSEPPSDQSVESAIRTCIPCQATSTQVQSAPLAMTPVPDHPWQQISADFCGPLPSGEYLLTVTDQYSKYPVVEIVSSTAADVVITRLEKIFAMFSYPSVIKTDNGPPFNSAAWAKYLASIGCKHRKITPLWPQANGQVETFNKPLMKAVRAAHIQGLAWKHSLHQFLQAYRFTPHSTTQLTPFKLLFGRDPQTKLPQIPEKTKSPLDNQLRSTVQMAQDKAKTYADAKHTRCPSLAPGDTVLVRQRRRHKLSTPFNPVPLTVTFVNGTLVTAKRPDNSTITRNISHFRRVPCQTVNDLDIPTDDDTFPDVPDNDVAPDIQDNNNIDMNIPDNNNVAQDIPRRSDRTIRRPERLIEQM